MKKNPDIWIIFATVGLLLFNLFNLFGTRRDVFVNQLVFICIGYAALYIFYKIGTNFFNFNARLFYILSVLILIATYVIGETVRGSRRWIDFYFFQFQPSEFFRLFFIAIFAAYFAGKSRRTIGFWVKSALLCALPAFIILKQPDLGTAITYVCAYVGLLFLAGFPMKYFISVGVASFFASPFIWSVLKEYQQNRIISFLKPEADSQGIAYNLIQAVITVGSGGLFGRGLGLGTQSRYQFLPEYHTDFAFATLIEQFGLAGGAIVMILYVILIYRLIKKALLQPYGSFSFYFLYGVVLFLSVSAIVNIGMNIGVMPVVGIALPFISAGGSSVVATLMMIGLALSI